MIHDPHHAGRSRHHHDRRRGRPGPWAPFDPAGGPTDDPRAHLAAMGRRLGGFVRRGGVRPLILAALAKRPMHGYEVIGELEAQSGGRWRPSAGSIYPTLQQLADEGLVTGEETDGRRVYTLTEAGRQAAAEAPTPPWAERGGDRSVDIGHLGRGVVQAAIQVQRVGSPEAVVAAQAILVDARSKLYGLLAADVGSELSPEASDQ